MTSIEKCIEHWKSVEKTRKEEIQEIIKELDKICITQPFNYSMFESRMHDLRRLRIEVEHIFWFINSMENYRKLYNVSKGSDSLTKEIIDFMKKEKELKEQLPQQEISDEEIKKSMREYNITDFGQMAAYITGAQWYREQLKLKL